MTTTTINAPAKLQIARQLALWLAKRTDSDVLSEDVEWYTEQQVYDYLARWGYYWEQGAWHYGGAV